MIWIKEVCSIIKQTFKGRENRKGSTKYSWEFASKE